MATEKSEKYTFWDFGDAKSGEEPRLASRQIKFS